MKDKNGIEIKCENCDDFIPAGTNGRGCALYEEDCENVFGEKRCIFKASSEALEARIKELQDELYADKYNYESWEEIKEEHQKLEATILKLQKELNIVQESERAEAREADRLREEVKVLKAFVIKVHTSPVIFEDVNRALRDDAKTLLEKLNQSAESEQR